MRGRKLRRKPLSKAKMMTVAFVIIVPAKTVPAAAVIQWEQVLFYMNRRKGCVGCSFDFSRKAICILWNLVKYNKLVFNRG